MATYNSLMAVEKYYFIYIGQINRIFFKTSKIFQNRIKSFEVSSGFAIYHNPQNVSVLSVVTILEVEQQLSLCDSFCAELEIKDSN